MCYRVRLAQPAAIQTLFGNAANLEDYDAADELSSGYDHPLVPVLTAYPPPQLVAMEWGLIPTWCGDVEQATKMQHSTLNARADSLLEKPSFKDAIRERRCIVFLAGFYEHQHRRQGNKTLKQPYFVTMRDGTLMPAAGIWSEWRGRRTVSIITTDANPLMAEIHNTKLRQPHLIEEPDWAQWLGPLNNHEIMQMLSVFPETNMQADEYAPPAAGLLF